MLLQACAEAAEAEASRLEDEIDDVSNRLDAAEADLTAARAMAEALKVVRIMSTSLFTLDAVPELRIRAALQLPQVGMRHVLFWHNLMPLFT